MGFNKQKIVNDPVYGFIKIDSPFLYDLIEHPYFQRLRRIKQLGLTNFVYPGANHSRFQHALGALHLMGLAIEVVRSKGHEIAPEEAEAVKYAILLHDIGHGPFSHTLEHTVIQNVPHEYISLLLMEQLNDEFNGGLDLAIKIFRNQYEKKFLHQLVSSQLDMDRLDYLKRDSFFTGVTEGVIGSDRIIKMLNVVDDQLVIDSKGIYSIEKFLIARRLMYWQVYLHKTVLAAEKLLVNTLLRAKHLAQNGVELFCTPALHYFLYNNIGKDEFISKKEEVLQNFTNLDDDDIIASAKTWTMHPDILLSTLCNGLKNRKLFKIVIRTEPFSNKILSTISEKVQKAYAISKDESYYLVLTGSISNNAYDFEDDKINILYKSGEIADIAEASDMLNVSVLSKVVKKYFLCFPKEFENEIKI
ncbi:MAG: HD domain-containing protein [Bacteroidales bacterium]|nr:HD domain-containing protein [Bacteroidales bacterium]